jgi:enamine deaminase RidA (YjgF/YER057c/UK114 family)
MVKRWDFDRTIKCSSFTTLTGANEYYLTLTNDKSTSFVNAVSQMNEKYRFVTNSLGLSDQTLVFSRLHVSDIANQKEQLEKSDLFRAIGNGVISVIEQTPLSSDSIVLFSYHVKRETGSFEKKFLDNGNVPWRTAMAIKGDHYSMVWSCNHGEAGRADSKEQTETLFASFSDFLGRHDLRLRSNLVRTWIYVNDIDNRYNGMVEARKNFFNSHGLCSESRFVASTGIEGRSGVAGSVVAMDSLSLGNIDEKQITTIDALDHMPRTIGYGVTFERGLRVKFGDRSHLIISGTASIDKEGRVTHEGDAGKQTHRAIDNVEALLRSQGAALKDMAYVLCYLRNPGDYECVKEIVNERLAANIPIVVVEAAVCRPAWLFEMEGVAIIAETNPFPPFM